MIKIILNYVLDKNSKYNFQKISNISFYIFIFLLPWQTIYFLRETFILGEKWQYGTIGIYLSEIFLIVWIFLEVILQRKKIFKTFQDNRILFWLSFGLLFFFFISIFQSQDKWLSLNFFVIFLQGFSLFWLFKNAKIENKKVIQILIFSSLLQSFLGIYQFIFQTSFSSKYLGLQEHVIDQGGTAVIENGNGRWLRAYGGFSHPNIFGGFLSLIFVFVLHNFLFSNQNRNSRIYYFFSLNIIFLGILTSFSRSTFLSFFSANFLIYLYLIIFYKNFFKKLILPTFSLLSVFSIFFFFYSNLFFTRTNLENRLEQKSVDERVSQVSQSFSIIKNNFWQGIGLGNYTLFLYQNDYFQAPIWQYQPVHNVYLLLFSEVGFFGFLFFLSFIFYFIIHFIEFFKNKIFFKSEKYFLFFSFVAFFSLLIIGLFDHWFYSFYFGIIFFWFILSLLNKFYFEKYGNF